MDYYILTMVAIGRELACRNLTTAAVHLAVGLPLTWVSKQKDSFKAYLLQNETLNFTFKGIDYHVTFVGADVFPQGFAVVVENMQAFKGVNVVCDIGNGTMNIMYINNYRPQERRCFTDKFGTHQCMLAARESLMRKHGKAVDDMVIENVLRYGTADIDEQYLSVIRDAATEYVAGIFRRLREHEYDSGLMRLFVVGGGSCLVKSFGQYDEKRVTILSDVCANAKGYEYLTRERLKKGGRL